MRTVRFLTALITLGLLPVMLFAQEEKLYVSVAKLDGTIMVERAKDQKKEALQTGSVVERGDIVTVHDKSWVILRSPKGDMIGLDSQTKATFDELFKAKSSGSRQSFFEVMAGNLVASLQRVRTVLSYDPKRSLFDAKFFDGRMIVIDSEGDQVFPFRYCKRIWDNGKMTQEDPLPLEEEDIQTFKDFWAGALPKVR
jgi:hypothetical protein